MKKTERKRLSNNWKKAKELWAIQQRRFNLYNWKIRLSDMNDKAGLCVYKTKRIYLSSILLRGSNCDYKKVKKTLYHEIAHVLTPGHGHDNVWKNMAQKLGGDDRLACTVMKPGMNWSVHCSKCRWTNEYIIKPDLTRVVCMHCGTKPIIKYIH